MNKPATNSKPYAKETTLVKNGKVPTSHKRKADEIDDAVPAVMFSNGERASAVSGVARSFDSLSADDDASTVCFQSLYCIFNC